MIPAYDFRQGCARFQLVSDLLSNSSSYTPVGSFEVRLQWDIIYGYTELTSCDVYFVEKFKEFLTSNYRKHVMEILSADVTWPHYSITVE